MHRRPFNEFGGFLLVSANDEGVCQQIILANTGLLKRPPYHASMVEL